MIKNFACDGTLMSRCPSFDKACGKARRRSRPSARDRNTAISRFGHALRAIGAQDNSVAAAE